jgi:putative methyltransferase
LMRMLKDKENEIKNYLKSKNFIPDGEINENEDFNKMYFRINEQKKDNQSLEFISKSTKDNFINGLYFIEKSNNGELVNKIFELKNSSDIVIQTKSSCIPAYILKLIASKNNFNTFDIIDSCSAPGNKTLQLAEYFPNSKVHAFEINEKRYETLNDTIKKYNFNKNVITIKDDFLAIDPNNEKYSKVKIILCDPSCSGSGTFNNTLVDKDKDQSLLKNECVVSIAGSYLEKDQIDRLTKLAKFQAKVIEHSMKFPNVEYISYSTCSIFMTENEYVVDKVLKNNKNFRLHNIFQLPEVEEEFNFHKGLTENTEGTLRTCRTCNKIDGFYVAIFERIKE